MSGEAESVLFAVGDIGISQHWVVTPNGHAPLRGSTWIGVDRSMTTTNIPTWAIVCAVVFFFACFLGLLFLLAKEHRTGGYFEVTVRSGSLQHTTQIAALSPAHVVHLRQLVGQAQAMAVAA